MNGIVEAALERELVQLARLVPQPAGELGFGGDLSCVSDLTVDLAEVDPQSVRAIGEAAIRRLTTPRGSLRDDPDYGLDVRTYCNRGATPAELLELAGRCTLELSKDDRIESSVVTPVLDLAANSLSLSVVITPANPALVPFTLTFAVTAGAVVLEELG